MIHKKSSKKDKIKKPIIEYFKQYMKEDARTTLLSMITGVTTLTFINAFFQIINLLISSDPVQKIVAYLMIVVFCVIVGIILICCFDNNCCCFPKRKKPNFDSPV
jgi:hypothetical protein